MAGNLKTFRYLDLARGDDTVPIFFNSAAPSNGVNGTAANVAGPGSLLVTSEPNVYYNSGTLASPVWTNVLSGVSDPVPQYSYQAIATAPTGNNLNLTGAQITGASSGVNINLTASLGAGATLTLPTVAALVTAMQAAGINPVVGASYELTIISTSGGAFNWTVTTNTGWGSLLGTMTIPQNTGREFIVTFGAGLATATLQSLGGYTINGGI